MGGSTSGRAQWLAAVEATLPPGGPGGADDETFAERFARRLVHRSEDGIEVQPLYTAADVAEDRALPGFAPYVRGSRAAGSAPDGWEARQRVWVGTAGSDPVEELEQGATGLLLDLRGLSAEHTVDQLDQVLTGVLLDLAPVSLDAGGRWGAAAEALLGLWDRRGTAGDDRRGTLGADPIGQYARTGGAGDLDIALAEMITLASAAADSAPYARVAVVDGAELHGAGATAAQEVGWATAIGAAYVRALVGGGLAAERSFATLEFRFAATADQFETITKLRAARRVWSRVAELAGVRGPAAAQQQHALTAESMLARYDPWTNALRSTIACFAAGIAGADAVTVAPHDLLRAPAGTRVGRRLARNTQSILRAESNLGRFVDPAGGSWYAEHLTADLAAASWAAMQEVEQADGFLGALTSGLVDERLAHARERRAAEVATRRRPITGVSEFPDIGEPPPDPSGAPARRHAGTPFPPVVAHRLAEAFEAQRGRADALAAAGARPEVYLATIGPPSATTARATFAKNLFEAGGIRAVSNEAAVDADSIEAAYRASGAEIACLCSTDDRYADVGAMVADRLRGAGARQVFLAGSGLDVPGVDEEVHRGTDALDVISRTLDLLRAPA